jgi:cytosine/adenosine deaminase-related metal-dependent hydrolase
MAQAVRLTGARVALTATRAEQIDLTIRGGRILPFDARVDNATEHDLSGHLLLPGLINAHDHLEFNLFPRLGRGPYPNAAAWAADIYHPAESPIKEQLRVPKKARLLWGGIKNLLSGVTTVAHHNPFEPAVFNRQFPVRVLRKFGWAHSLDFSPHLVESLDRTPPDWPFIVHAAEGTDERARGEIGKLKELGALTGRTVVVHAVGIDPCDLETIRQSGSSIVWCPTSNLFTLGRTLSPETLMSGVNVALGTDSALSGKGDLIDEMRCASADIYPLVTTNAARVLRLRNGAGTIRERGVADLLAVRDLGQTPGQALRKLHPELVMIGGRIMLVSERYAGTQIKGFHPIHVEGRGHWLVRADIPRLHAAAVQALGTEIRLAGKRVCP